MDNFRPQIKTFIEICEVLLSASSCQPSLNEDECEVMIIYTRALMAKYPEIRELKTHDV